MWLLYTLPLSRWKKIMSYSPGKYEKIISDKVSYPNVWTAISLIRIYGYNYMTGYLVNKPVKSRPSPEKLGFDDKWTRFSDWVEVMINMVLGVVQTSGLNPNYGLVWTVMLCIVLFTPSLKCVYLYSRYCCRKRLKGVAIKQTNTYTNKAGSWIKCKCKTLEYNLNRKYDVCSCLSQSENTQSKSLYVKTDVMRVYERACHEDWPSIPSGYFLSDHS